MNFMFEDLRNNTILGTPIFELEEMAEELKHSLIKSINKRLKITVKNILYLTGGNTKIEIRNCNRDDGAFDSILWSGIVDDVEWGNEPFKDHEVMSMTVVKDEDVLRIYVDMPTYLYNADSNCQHLVVDVPSGGIKCKKCGGWYAL